VLTCVNADRESGTLARSGIVKPARLPVPRGVSWIRNWPQKSIRSVLAVAGDVLRLPDCVRLVVGARAKRNVVGPITAAIPARPDERAPPLTIAVLDEYCNGTGPPSETNGTAGTSIVRVSPMPPRLPVWRIRPWPPMNTTCGIP